MKNSKIEHKKERSKAIFIQLIKEKDTPTQSMLKKLYDQILKDIK